MYSSRSWIDWESKVSLSMGSLIRSRRPWVQLRAPAIGGMLLEIGPLSSYLSSKIFPSMKIVWTFFKSCLYNSKRVICFFSSSSWIKGLLSKPSKESRSLNFPVIVSQSSKLWVKTEARRLSSSLMRWRNLKKSSSNYLFSIFMISYLTWQKSSTALWNSSWIYRIEAVRALPFVLPISIFPRRLN